MNLRTTLLLGPLIFASILALTTGGKRLCDAPLITATIRKGSFEVINIGPGATITIFKNGTRVVKYQRKNVLNGLKSGKDVGKPLIVNKLYANRTLVSEINKKLSFIIRPKYNRFIVYKYINNKKYLHTSKKVPCSKHVTAPTDALIYYQLFTNGTQYWIFNTTGLWKFGGYGTITLKPDGTRIDVDPRRTKVSRAKGIEHEKGPIATISFLMNGTQWYDIWHGPLLKIFINGRQTIDNRGYPD